jgi:hypothetical protein
MEISREKPVVGNVAGNEELRAVPKRALSAITPVAREVGHAPEEIHERLARNYQCASETTSRLCSAADLNLEIAKNMDRYNVKNGTPLHERFAALVASV